MEELIGLPRLDKEMSDPQAVGDSEGSRVLALGLLHFRDAQGG